MIQPTVIIAASNAEASAFLTMNLRDVFLWAGVRVIRWIRYWEDLYRR